LKKYIIGLSFKIQADFTLGQGSSKFNIYIGRFRLEFQVLERMMI